MTNRSSLSLQTIHSIGTEGHDTLTGVGTEVMDLALPPDLRDDRFVEPEPIDHLGVVARLAGVAVAFAGGPLTDNGAVVDIIVRPQPASEAGTDRDDDRTDADEITIAVFDRFVDELDRLGAPSADLEIWAKPSHEWHDHLARHRDLVPYRALHQMRAPLPVDAPVLPTVAFRPGVDDEDLLRTNNRAFAQHPVQGQHTRTTFQALFDQDWFEPDGVRLHHDDDGHLIGFCWTKIHQPGRGSGEGLGEIFVIGIDPDHHGQGLGVPMTAAGLDWLAGQGLSTAMLYVEADNAPAIGTYEKLGFTIHRTDRAWRTSPTT